MEDKFKKFAEDLEMIDRHIHILNNHLQTLAERQRHINTLRAEIDHLQSIIDEQRRHA